MEHADDAVVRFGDKFLFKKSKVMRGNLKDSLLKKQIEKPRLALLCCKALSKRLEKSRSGEKHSTTSTTSRVSP